MLNFNEAKDILKYYGFVSNSVEPTLCLNNEDIGIFATFKTKYGHLSRFVKFKTKEEMKKFLTIYLWYRKNLNDNKVNVEFDNYEKVDPTIKFLYENIEVTASNVLTINLIDTKVEELIIDTTEEENLKLLNIVFEKIRKVLKEIDSFQNNLQDIIIKYKEKLKEYNSLINSNDDNKIKVDKINTDTYYEEINKISNLYNGDIDNFKKYFIDTVNLYEELLLNEVYFENLYLYEYYQEQIRVLDIKIELFGKYTKEINSEKTKLFKNKKNNVTYEEYVTKHDISEKLINKNDIIYNKKTDMEKELVELKNNSIEDLKLIYKIVIVPEKEIEIKEEVSHIDNNVLNYYFMSLTKDERNNILILSSPLKELINLIDSIENKDIKNIILNEKYYKEKFSEIYEILSNKDNYAATRKYLKFLKLDYLEDFISSLIDFKNSLNITPFALPINTVLKFKMGVFLNQGYINASIDDEYPVNSKGFNNYCIATNQREIHAYYSPYVLTIDNDNLLVLKENNNIITLKLNGLKFIEKEEVNVNNYMLKKKANEQFKFILFNEKKYISSKIIENGDVNE